MATASPSRELEILGGSVGAAVLGMAAAGAWLIPDLLGRLPACVLKSLTGLPCLTCGGTRAALALVRLDPVAALVLNPLAALGLAGALVWLGYTWLVMAGLLAPLRTGLLRPPLPRSLRWSVLVALALNWIYLIAAGR